jgi:cell division protease FtsH
VSDATALEIDKEARGLVDRAHERALAILHHNRELLETISHKILEKEVIEGEELKQLLANSVMPSDSMAAT